MAYKKTNWQDTLRDAQGNVIQKGTPLNAQALGKIEDGIVAAEQKIDNEISQVTTQLAQTNQQINVKEIKQKNRITQYNKTRKPLISFVDDDGNKAILTRLKPEFDARGIKAGLAIITGNTDTNPNCLTSSEIIMLAEEGWEILGHGHSYASGNLYEFTNDADLEYQLGEGCKDNLESLSPKIKVNGFVYPQSGHDKRIRKFTKKYYDFAFGNNGYNKEKFIDTTIIKRIGFGSYTTGNPDINGERNTLNYYKGMVDNAIRDNAWLVFMVHCNDHDEVQQSYLPQLLDYIQSKGVDIVLPSEGYEYFGNNLFIGDLEDKFVVANSNGLFTNETEDTTRYKMVRLAANSVTPSNVVTDFEDRTITTCNIAGSSASVYPEGLAGTLITYRNSGDVTYPNNNKQEYWLYGSEKVYRRTAISPTTWSAWNDGSEYGTTQIKPSNFLPESALITSYPDKKITVFVVSGASPYSLGVGIITTYRVSGNGWNRQEFRKYDTHEIWVRYVKASDGSWSAWIQVGGGQGTTANRPSNPPIGYSYFDTNLGKPIWYKALNNWVDATGVNV